MDRRAISRYAFLSVVASISMMLLADASLPTVDGASQIPGTRATGEDLTINLTLSFDGPYTYVVDVQYSIHKLILNGSVKDKSEIRTDYASSPSVVAGMLEDELLDRGLELVNTSLQGDSFSILSYSLDEGSMSNSTANSGLPIRSSMMVGGSSDIARFLNDEYLDRLEEDDLEMVITGLLLSGFGFERTVHLRAQEGETVNYLIPDSFDPIGDGKVSLLIQNSMFEKIDDHYLATVDADFGVYSKEFTFIMSGSPPVTAGEEEFEAAIMIDWWSLGSMRFQGGLDLSSLRSDREGMIEGLPSSMKAPSNIPNGLIRLSFLEGLMDSADIVLFEGGMEDELEPPLRTAADNDSLEVEVTVDIGTSGLSKPDNGEELLAVLRASSPITADLTSNSILIDLKGYDGSDIMGLLNGGLRLRRVFDQLSDERVAVEIEMPPYLTFYGEEPETTAQDGRHIFGYVPTIRTISSTLVPQVDEEDVRIDALVDLSDVESNYGLDAKVNVQVDGTVRFRYMEYDPMEYIFQTSLDYELDMINSDMLRLLVQMEIIDENEITTRVGNKLSDIMADLVPPEDQVMSVTFTEGTLGFDGDTFDMNGDEPVVLGFYIHGSSEPFGGSGLSGSSVSVRNVFIPFHYDPFIPVKSIKRTIALESVMEWTLNLSMRFPNGFKVRGWLGDGDNDKVKALSTEVVDVYPTLYLTPEDGKGDHMYLELSLGPYFGFNNVLLCFATTIGAVLLLLLIIFISVIKKIRRRRKAKKEREAAMAGELGGQGKSDLSQGSQQPAYPGSTAPGGGSRTSDPYGKWKY